MNSRILSAAFKWFGRLETTVLLGALLVVAGIWGFIALADVVQEGRTQKFDDFLLRAPRRSDNPAMPIGPDWVTEAARDMTALGGAAAMSLVTLIVAGYLLFDRKYAAMFFVLAAVIGGLILSTLLKEYFDRPRPEIVPRLSGVYTSSFPSGHSMISAVVYLTLGSLLTHITPNRRLKIYFLAVAFMLTGMVGISRVYMGVHYPTDVLAGWTAGLVWAVVCLLMVRLLRRQGKIIVEE